MRQSFNLLRLMFNRERADFHRWIMDGFAVRNHRNFDVLHSRWECAADNAIMVASFACDLKQLPERAESLSFYGLLASNDLDTCTR